MSGKKVASPKNWKKELRDQFLNHSYLGDCWQNRNTSSIALTNFLVVVSDTLRNYIKKSRGNSDRLDNSLMGIGFKIALADTKGITFEQAIDVILNESKHFFRH